MSVIQYLSFKNFKMNIILRVFTCLPVIRFLLLFVAVPPLLSNVTLYLRFSSVFDGILPTQYVDVNGTLDHIENTV